MEGALRQKQFKQAYKKAKIGNGPPLPEGMALRRQTDRRRREKTLTKAFAISIMNMFWVVRLTHAN